MVSCKGLIPFTITSTAYDQKFIYGRNIYSNIDRLVDSIFANYLSRPGVRQPIFTAIATEIASAVRVSLPVGCPNISVIRATARLRSSATITATTCISTQPKDQRRPVLLASMT